MNGFMPIHILVEYDVLKQLDEYKSSDRTRSYMVREAIKMYIHEMERTQQRKSVWAVQKK